MKITVLGCGGSSGVPLVGCRCTVCASGNTKNRRSRVSILVETGGKRLLVDTSPDLRRQCLDNAITGVDAILYTHAHADHCHGIDDVRSLNYHREGPIDCYGDRATLEEMKQRFAYAFRDPMPEYGWFRPCLTPHEIVPFAPFAAAGVEALPFTQIHGKVESLGFRIGDFAYSTDVNGFPETSFEALRGIELWIVDCLKYEPSPTHAHLDLTLEWIARVRPKRAVLTHMGHEFDYDALRAALPEGVEPGYDGMPLLLD